MVNAFSAAARLSLIIIVVDVNFSTGRRRRSAVAAVEDPQRCAPERLR